MIHLRYEQAQRGYVTFVITGQCVSLSFFQRSLPTDYLLSR